MNSNDLANYSMDVRSEANSLQETENEMLIASSSEAKAKESSQGTTDLRTIDESQPGCGQQAEGFQFIELEEFMKKQVQDREWVVENLLIKRGSSILAGEPKAGKSTFVRTLILAVATGRPVFGRKSLKGPVLYLALEELDSEVQRQFLAMRKEWPEPAAPIHLHIGPAPQDSKESLKSLEAAIRKYKPVLVVVDVLQELLRINDMNDYTQTTSALRGVHRLARESGCHIMVVHHTGKRGEGVSTAGRVLGSTGLISIPDAILFYGRKGDIRVFSCEHGRFGARLSAKEVMLDEESCLVSPASEAAGAGDSKLAEKIRTVLCNGKLLAEKEIQKLVGGDTAKANRTLKELTAAGILKRDGLGKKGSPWLYSLMPATEPENGSPTSDDSEENCGCETNRGILVAPTLELAA